MRGKKRQLKMCFFWSTPLDGGQGLTHVLFLIIQLHWPRLHLHSFTITAIHRKQQVKEMNCYCTVLFIGLKIQQSSMIPYNLLAINFNSKTSSTSKRHSRTNRTFFECCETTTSTGVHLFGLALLCLSVATAQPIEIITIRFEYKISQHRLPTAE